MTKKRAIRKILLPDLHMGAHDEQALAVALAAVRRWDPDEIVVLGDWLDGALFSRHPKRTFDEDMAHGFLAGEVGPVNAVLDKMQVRGGRAPRKLVYIAGNHEARCEAHAVSIGGKLGEDIYKLMSPERLITERVDANGKSHGQRRNFTWIPYFADNRHSHYVVCPEMDEITALIAIHGWSIAKHFADVNMTKARSHSVVCGHTHRHQVVESRDPLTGKTIMSWSPGCLAKLKPAYMQGSPGDWTHGFTCIYQGQRGWTPHHVTITNTGRAILPDGTEVRA